MEVDVPEDIVYCLYIKFCLSTQDTETQDDYPKFATWMEQEHGIMPVYDSRGEPVGWSVANEEELVLLMMKYS